MVACSQPGSPQHGLDDAASYCQLPFYAASAHGHASSLQHGAEIPEHCHLSIYLMFWLLDSNINGSFLVGRI